jgi:hypothetical protein
MEEAPKIKGVAIREFFAWYKSRFGQAYVAERISRLPAQAQSAIDVEDEHLGLIDSNWYPAELVHTLLDSAARGMSASERTQLMRDGARVALSATLRGVYKLLFDSMMTPDRYLRRAQALFGRYFNTGTITKTAETRTSHLTLIHNWSSHHPLLCDFVQYTAETVYGAMGCKNVESSRLSCISTGAALCSFRVTWSPPR